MKSMSPTWLILAALVQRGVNLLTSTLALRWAGAAAVGIASLELDLLLGTLLFLAREGPRIAALRAPRDGSVQLPALAGVSWCLGGLLTACAAAMIWVGGATWQHQLPAYVFTGAAVVELLSEGVFLRIQQVGAFQVKGQAITAGAVLRGVSTVAGVWYLPGRAELAFAIGQLVYACTLSGWLIVWGISQQRMLWAGVSLPTWAAIREAGTYVAQCVLKHALTEGDRIVTTIVASPEEKGVLAAATAYGALVVRAVLLPMEETSRAAFAAIWHSEEYSDEVQRKRDVLAAAQAQLLRVSTLGYIIGMWGSAAVTAVVPLLLGERWVGTSLTTTLTWYCLYIPVLAVNGMVEGLAFITAPPSGVALQNALHTAIGVLSYAGLAAGAWHAGAAGVVMANIASMAARISVALLCIHRYTAAGVPGFRLTAWLGQGLPSLGSAAFIFASSVACHALDWYYPVVPAHMGPFSFIKLAYSAVPLGLLGLTTFGVWIVLFGKAYWQAWRSQPGQRTKQD